MMPKTHRLCLALLLCLNTIGSGREFEDQFGRTIDVELVGHWGISNRALQVRRDGKLVQVKIENFAKKHHAEIEKWISDNPLEIPDLLAPPKSGDGVLGGSRWKLTNYGAALTTLELRSDGKIVKNGELSKSGWWKETDGGFLQFDWGGIEPHTFDKSVIGDRLYLCSKTGGILTPVEGIASPRLTKGDFVGASFIVAHPGYDLNHFREPGPRAMLEFTSESEFQVGEYTGKWKFSDDKLILNSHKGGWKFVRIGRGIYGGYHHGILWKITPPRAS